MCVVRELTESRSKSAGARAGLAERYNGERGQERGRRQTGAAACCRLSALPAVPPRQAPAPPSPPPRLLRPCLLPSCPPSAPAELQAEYHRMLRIADLSRTVRCGGGGAGLRETSRKGAAGLTFWLASDSLLPLPPAESCFPDHPHPPPPPLLSSQQGEPGDDEPHAQRAAARAERAARRARPRVQPCGQVRTGQAGERGAQGAWEAAVWGALVSAGHGICCVPACLPAGRLAASSSLLRPCLLPLLLPQQEKVALLERLDFEGGQESEVMKHHTRWSRLAETY